MTSKRQRYKTPRRLRGKTEDHECISRKALSFGLLCGEKKRYYSCKEGSRKTDILRLFLQWFKTTYLEQGEKLQERGRRYKNPEGNS